MVEVVNNSYADPTTFLDGAINNSVLSLDVLDAGELPSGGTFRILIWDGDDDATKEVLEVASFTGNTLTITTRGSDDTTAVSHGDGERVELIVTETALRNMIYQDSASAIITYLTGR